jgi:hypothetical protein
MIDKFIGWCEVYDHPLIEVYAVMLFYPILAIIALYDIGKMMLCKE